MAISTDSALPENRVKISEDLRSMNVPTGEQVLGCVGDAWVRRVWFDMPRYCDGTDLSGYTLSVNYRNTDEDEDRYPVNDAVVNADTITFSWLVGAVACAAPGLTSVSIKAQKLNGDTVENEFNSTIYYFKVLPANTTGAEPLQEYSDAFTTLMLQWQAEVDTAVAEAPKGKLVGTASGTTAQTVNDAWPTTPESAVLYGKSVQDGTPTPDNPVPVQVVGGRNLVFKRIEHASVDPSGKIIVNNAVDLLVAKVVNGGVYTVAQDWGGLVCGFYATEPAMNSVSYNSSRTQQGANQPITAPIDGYIAVWTKTGYQYGQIEAGTQATPYTPYGCIGLQIGETVTPIDLQGHTLAGLDVLNIDSAGRVWIDSDALEITLDGSQNWNAYSPFDAAGQYGYFFRTPETLYYNTAETTIICDAMQGISRNMLNPSLGITDACAVTTNGIEISARLPFADVAAVNAYFTANPAKAYARRATPQTIELGTIDLPELTQPCELAIYASLDPEWAITYEQDPNIVVTALQSSIAPVEGSTASTNYAVNSYLIHANQLYRVTSAIATGETIAPGSNCVACTVMGEVIRLTA